MVLVSGEACVGKALTRYFVSTNIGDWSAKAASIKHSNLWSMRYGDMRVSSVGGMEATFSRSGTAIGEGSTPVVVGRVIVSSMLGFVLFPNRFRGRLGEGLDMIGYNMLVVVCVVLFVFFRTSGHR